MKQLKLFKENNIRKFGGSLLKGKRKSKRPLSLKHAIHLVLHGDVGPCGSMRIYQRQITNLMNKFAVRFDVKIYKLSVNSNHLHLLIKIHSRAGFNGFVRALAGAISLMLDVRWLVRPFTRIVSWGRDFQTVVNYVIKNILEASGEISYKRGKKQRQI